MQDLEQLMRNNAEWANKIKAEDPHFFEELSKQQSPEYLWIGCADSRVPANQLVGLLPGEIFVHRNIANCVVHTDLNCLSVIYFAVKVLKVKHIIVTGHYDCGGIKAGMGNKRLGLIDHWLRNIRELYLSKLDELNKIDGKQEKFDRMCELNVIKQVSNIAQIPEVQEAWTEGQALTIHGLIYDLKNGHLKQVAEPVNNIDAVDEAYRLI